MKRHRETKRDKKRQKEARGDKERLKRQQKT